MMKWNTDKPIRNAWYLVSFREQKSDPYDFADVDVAHYIGDGRWWVQGYDRREAPVVDAWMELPDPYNPEVTGGDSN